MSGISLEMGDVHRSSHLTVRREKVSMMVNQPICNRWYILSTVLLYGNLLACVLVVAESQGMDQGKVGVTNSDTSGMNDFRTCQDQEDLVDRASSESGGSLPVLTAIPDMQNRVEGGHCQLVYKFRPKASLLESTTLRRANLSPLIPTGIHDPMGDSVQSIDSVLHGSSCTCMGSQLDLSVLRIHLSGLVLLVLKYLVEQGHVKVEANDLEKILQMVQDIPETALVLQVIVVTIHTLVSIPRAKEILLGWMTPEERSIFGSEGLST